MKSEICFIIVRCNEDLELGCKKASNKSKSKEKHSYFDPTVLQTFVFALWSTSRSAGARLRMRERRKEMEDSWKWSQAVQANHSKASHQWSSRDRVGHCQQCRCLMPWDNFGSFLGERAWYMFHGARSQEPENSIYNVTWSILGDTSTT